MSVLAKCGGIVIRLLHNPLLGPRLHAFFGDGELIVDLRTLSIVQGDVPDWVCHWVLDWARNHRVHLMPQFTLDPVLAAPVPRRAAAAFRP